MRFGFGVGADDAYLVLRSLPTMKLRFDAHDAAVRKVARWLQGRSEIAAVLHPALPDCPGHAVWQRDFTGAGGLFSVLFDPRYSEAQTDGFVDRSEEHTSELQSLIRISYAVFCLKKKKNITTRS